MIITRFIYNGATSKLFGLAGCMLRLILSSGQIGFFGSFSPSWVKTRLYTKNQLPMLPGSALTV